MSTVDKKFIELLRLEFDNILSTKTGWGRNELKLAFEQALGNALVTWASQK